MKYPYISWHSTALLFPVNLQASPYYKKPITAVNKKQEWEEQPATTGLGLMLQLAKYSLNKILINEHLPEDLTSHSKTVLFQPLQKWHTSSMEDEIGHFGDISSQQESKNKTPRPRNKDYSASKPHPKSRGHTTASRVSTKDSFGWIKPKKTHALIFQHFSRSWELCLGMEVRALLLHAVHHVSSSGGMGYFCKASAKARLDAVNSLPFWGEAESHGHCFTLWQRAD